jgi:hypothetical protein
MGTLPSAFADLESFVSIWALPTENLRSQKRWKATSQEFNVFYTAFLPRLQAVLEELDKHHLGSMPPDAKRLLHLALAFAEVAPHVELYKGENQVPLSFDNSRFTARHGDVEAV